MIRSTDTSPLPAAARGPDGHTHPLPTYVRVALFAYAGMLALALTGLLALFLQAQHTTEARTAYVDAELNRRTAAREAADRAQQEQHDAQAAQAAAQDARTVAAVCTVLAADLPPSPRITALRVELRCPRGTNR